MASLERILDFAPVGATEESWWLGWTPARRWAHMEQLRRMNHGDAAAGRLQRVLEIVPCPWVRHPLVGGWAVGFHGRPRATQDLEVWIEVSPENAARIRSALLEFGFDAPVESFLDPQAMVRMGIPPLRIELLPAVSGLEFEEADKNALEGRLDEIEVRVVSLADMRRNKRAAGRYKDLDDLENLPEA